jgi:hypothetical protein
MIVKAEKADVALAVWTRRPKSTNHDHYAEKARREMAAIGWGTP